MPKRVSPNVGVTLAEANLRIASLSRSFITPCAMRENLCLPLEADIRITPDPGSHKLSLIVDGVEVSWCREIDFQQQIGSVALRMGGLAGVGTHNDHRFKGYSKRVLTNSLRWLRREEYDTAMLYGISGYYPKFGYAEAFPTVQSSMLVRDAELAPRGRVRFVDYQASHCQAVMDMFNINNTSRTGVTRRDPKRWTKWRQGLQWPNQALGMVGLDGRRQPVCYIVRDATANGTILEIGYRSSDCFPDLLAAARDITWSVRQERIVFHLSPDEPFLAFCKRFGLYQETTYRRDGGAMVRLINVRSSMQKLAPLLASRMAGSGRLTIRTNLDDVGLRWGGGDMAVVGPLKTAPAVKLPQWALAQLVYGYKDVATLSLERAATGDPKALTMLAEMFPAGVHYHHTCDKF